MVSKVDFIAQSFALLLIGYILFTWQGNDQEFLVLNVQLVFAAWQILSGLIFLVQIKKQTRKYKRLTIIHWILLLIYFAVLGIAIPKGDSWFLTYWVQLAWWPVAMYYFVITTLRAFDIELLDPTTALED